MKSDTSKRMARSMLNGPQKGGFYALNGKMGQRAGNNFQS